MKESLAQKLVTLTIKLQEKLIAYLQKGKKPEREERLPLSGDAVTLDAIQGTQPEDHVKFDYTENSEIAKSHERAPAHGIDKFGEQDTFDPDEADDHQTDRDRNQNSDLSKRFYTHGLDVEDINEGP